MNYKTLYKSVPKECIKCSTTDKDKGYPMCYSCFLKWDSPPVDKGFMFVDDD